MAPKRLGDFKRLLRPPAVTRFTKVEEAILIILTAAYFTPYNSSAPRWTVSLTASQFRLDLVKKNANE